MENNGINIAVNYLYDSGIEQDAEIAAELDEDSAEVCLRVEKMISLLDGVLS